MNLLSPQIPFDLFETEPAAFDNFVVGANEELVTHLYGLAHIQQHWSVTVVWSGAGFGKSHLLKSVQKVLIAEQKCVVMLSVNDPLPASPFENTDALIIDDADRLSPDQQAFAFNAYNHMSLRGGIVVAAGGNAPARWLIRDDLRTRLASGLIFELHAPPQDDLPRLMAEHAEKRGIGISKEVLTYILTHSGRNVAQLAQTIAGIDRLSLASKRAITIPLVKAFLMQEHDSADAKN